MKYRVAISGSYGGMNLGDEAILEVILRELRASLDVDVAVFSHNAKDTEQRHKVRAVPIREVHSVGAGLKPAPTAPQSRARMRD